MEGDIEAQEEGKYVLGLLGKIRRKVCRDLQLNSVWMLQDGRYSDRWRLMRIAETI